MSAARLSSTPYARRLARERGLALDSIAGSGPHGRIVAGDVLAFVIPPPSAPPVEDLPAASTPPPVTAVALRSIGAFQASVDLAPLAGLIEASGAGLAIFPFLVKAASRAAGDRGARLSLRDAAGKSGLVEAAATASPSAIARCHEAGADGDAPFVVEWLEASGIRPLAASLPPSAELKLVIVAGGGRAELLLVHDEEAVAPAEAVVILSGICDLAESPLRLLV